MQAVPERPVESDEVKSDSTNGLLSNATCSYTETQLLVTAAKGHSSICVVVICPFKS